MSEIDLNHYPLDANVRILLTLGVCKIAISAKGRSINELGMNAIIDLNTVDQLSSPEEWQFLMESFQNCLVQIESDLVTDPVKIDCYIEQTYIYGNVVELNLSFFDTGESNLHQLTATVKDQWKRSKLLKKANENPLKIRKAQKRF